MLPAFRQMKRSPGSALQDHVGHDPGVGAGDEERGGFLVVGQVLEQAGTFGEHVGRESAHILQGVASWLASFVFAFSCSSVHEPRVETVVV